MESAQDKNFDNYLGFMTATDGAEHWIFPNTDTIKINVDAAIFNSFHSCNYAFIAKNCHGTLVEARAKYVQGSTTP